jgi:hypothetical protein
MKGFATILIFYFSALFLMPCSDAVNQCGDTFTTSDTEHHHDKDEDDNCGPFCTCACCSISLSSFNFFLHEFTTPFAGFITGKVIITEKWHVSGYYGNIWQPPRINS